MADLNVELTELDEVTTAVAAYVESLRGLIREGMTAAQVTEAHDKITRISTFLRDFAHDPQNPIPPQP
jgi:hypothetical protein